MTLMNKTAVVTGGANGIGAAICRRLRSDGANIVIVDIVEPDLGDFRAVDGPGEVHFIPCDVSIAADITECARTVLNRFEAVSILVNNAGGSGKVPVTRLEDHTDEVWQYVMDLNLTSIFRFSREFVPGMRQQKFGRIINMSSGVRHSTPPFVTMRSHFVYAVAKGAMVTLTKQMGRDLGPDGITTNAISPGMILPDPDARVTKIIMSQPEELQQSILNGIPVHRFGNGLDVAAMTTFLASEESGFVNGQTIDLTGGA